jgi:putative oxidoreductase
LIGYAPDKPFGEHNAMPDQTWKSIAILVARLIFGLLFVMAFTFKFLGMQMTADYIASAGFPMPLALAWIAAVFEVALAFCFLTGAYFTEAALLAGVYVIFLAFAFHGPNRFAAKQEEFGFFIDHFTFLAGLLFAAAHGPGRWSLPWRWLGR